MRIFINKLIVVAFLFTSTSAALAETEFVTWFGVNKKDMKFGRSFDTTTTDAGFIMASVSVTALLENYYVTLSGEAPMSKDEIEGGAVEADRNEFSVTVGCNCLSFMEELNTFIGYTSAKTEIIGSVPGSAFSEDHTDSGFYLGGSIPIYQGENKTLSISAAYALLSGEVVSSDEFTGVNGTFTGDTTGFSYGATLVGSLSKNMNYSLAYKIQNYFFETDIFGVDKNFTNLSASLTYFY